MKQRDTSNDVAQGRLTRRGFVGASLGLPLALGVLPLAAAQPTNHKTAKSVILLWMWGGPSHLDTFDPKPDAPLEIRGPFAPIQTRIPGENFSELFPRLAARTDRLSVIRSHINHDNAHHIAGSIALCGRRGGNADGDYDPNFGSIVGRANPGRGELPAFVEIGPGPLDTAAGSLKATGGGVWGPAYDPFPVRCTELSGVQLPTLRLLDGLNANRLSDRKLLVERLEARETASRRPRVDDWEFKSAQAFRLLQSAEGRRAFDLAQESDKTRRRYGRTQFGQSCLLARRLVEAGVPYIQVDWSQWVENIFDTRTDFGWDTHWLNFEHLADRHGPIFDRAMAALLDDLQERGLFDSTLVVAMGEFGRTPAISGNGGRDHWERCYSSLWAGGGVVGGRVIGESDRRAQDPVTSPITPEMVGATILDLVGIHSEQRAALRVLPNGRVIDELL